MKMTWNIERLEYASICVIPSRLSSPDTSSLQHLSLDSPTKNTGGWLRRAATPSAGEWVADLAGPATLLPREWVTLPLDDALQKAICMYQPLFHQCRATTVRHIKSATTIATV